MGEVIFMSLRQWLHLNHYNKLRTWAGKLVQELSDFHLATVEIKNNINCLMINIDSLGVHGRNFLTVQYQGLSGCRVPCTDFHKEWVCCLSQVNNKLGLCATSFASATGSYKGMSSGSMLFTVYCYTIRTGAEIKCTCPSTSVHWTYILTAA